MVFFEGAPHNHAWLGKEVGMDRIVRYIYDDSGATAIEYGLISALISVVMIRATKSLGTKLSLTFTKLARNM